MIQKLIIPLIIVLTITTMRAEGPSGRWEGSAEIPGRILPIIIDLTQEKSGKWVGSAILPGLGIKGDQLTDLMVKFPEVSFAMPNVFGGVIIKAKIAADEMTGDFQQAGHTAPCALTRIGPAQWDEPPRSTAVLKELEGEWKGQYEMFAQKRQIALKVANQKDGPAKVECTIVGRKENNVPIDFVSQDGELVTIESHALGMTLEGLYRKAPDEFQTTLIYGPFELPLVLRRAGK
jgi:hypothetical protein